MKHTIKKVLQKLLGMHGYLFIFSLFVIFKLRWDKNERDFLLFLKLVRNEGLILDIGANIGVMTWYFSKKKRNATILSFEPVYFNFKVLKSIKNIFRLKNVKIYKLALGEKEDTIDIIIPTIDSVKMHGLCHVAEDGQNIREEGQKISVKMISLDHFPDIRQIGQKVNAIKMDVENYEYFVLKGACELISKDRPFIYTELWDNDNRKKCISLLEDLNYRTYIFDNKKLVLFKNDTGSGQNFVFLPAEVNN